MMSNNEYICTIYIRINTDLTLKGECAVVSTDKIEGGAYHEEVIFVVFRLMKNINF